MYTITRADGTTFRSPIPGLFAGIKTTMRYGRLDCASGKRALAKNREFFHFSEDAEARGYKPCRNCKPEPYTRADCAKNEHLLGLTEGVQFRLGKRTRTGRHTVYCAFCDKRVGMTKS